jgi:hypothetical protein
MTGFRFHNAQVALGQRSKAGIAITLIKALFDRSVAVYAKDFPGIHQFNRLADQRI